jgi:LPXTG-motif cell wall-anchored protein
MRRGGHRAKVLDAADLQPRSAVSAPRLECVAVLASRRRLAPLLVAAAFAAAPAAAFAQGAGDQQYQDPFGGGSGSGGGGSQPTPNVTQTPQLSPSVSTPSASSGAGSAGTSSSAQAGSLPNTGADARLLGAFGLGLLLAGIGLRLRTADERF